MGQSIRSACGVALVVATFGLNGVGVAGAEPSTVGMTFAKAKAALNLTPNIASTSGSTLVQDDCIVTNQIVREAVVKGREVIPRQLYVSLNCYGSVATAGKPGNSAASPEGQLAKKNQAAIEWRETPDGQAWCDTAKSQHPDWFPIDGCPE